MKSIQVIYNMEFSRKLISNIFTKTLLIKSLYQKEGKGWIKANKV